MPHAFMGPSQQGQTSAQSPRWAWANETKKQKTEWQRGLVIQPKDS